MANDSHTEEKDPAAKPKLICFFELETPAGQAPQPDTVFNPDARCALCHLPKPSEELLVVPDRGFICTVCLDAVKKAAGWIYDRKSSPKRLH